MLDLGFVRDNLELVKQKMRERGLRDSLEDFENLDRERRKLLTEAEALKARRNHNWPDSSPVRSKTDPSLRRGELRMSCHSEHSQPLRLPMMGKNSTRVALDNVVDSKRVPRRVSAERSAAERGICFACGLSLGGAVYLGQSKLPPPGCQTWKLEG